ncbi:MAG TPA: ATP-binding protein, partial [Spirochaetia bacterium]
MKSSSLSRILYLISTIVPCIMGAALCVTIFALEVSDLRHEQARYREQCEQTARAVETLVDASDSALARRLVVQGSVSLGIALLFIAIGLVIAHIASRRLRATIDDLQSSLRGGVLDRRPILPTAMPYAELADLAGLANTMLEAREAANERWRKSEEQLHHAQKMESVARLLGGVVHDFNNLLTAIGGYSDLLATSVALDAEGQDFVAEIQKASSRAASLTQQLLAFSRKEPARKSLVDVNAVVMGMGRMCSRIVGESITLETHLCPGLCPVFMDASQLEQVLINLVVNSRDAIDGKGRISIETSAASAPLTRQGGWVVLSVRDSGCGMSDEVKRHLFEPYYTTKGQGKGTGLGLSIISSIVHQSEGFIDVDSRAGEGTVFRIHLPCHDGSDVPTEGR